MFPNIIFPQKSMHQVKRIRGQLNYQKIEYLKQPLEI